MSHRSIEQLKTTRAALVERLKVIRSEIRVRDNAAMTKLARGYAKTIAAAVKANGSKVPTPEELAVLLTAKPAPERPPRRRKPKAEA